MVEMLLNKRIIFVVLIISLLTSCNNKENIEQKFIEDNFLKIVDTIAYSRGAFISLSSDTIRYPELSVRLSQEISYNKKIDDFTLDFFEENSDLKIIFKDVLDNNTSSGFSLDSSFPKQIGKYHIFFNENEQVKTIKYAGRIDIENLNIYNDKAILVLSESVEHYGKTYIILLVKEGNHWKVVKREVLVQS